MSEDNKTPVVEDKDWVDEALRRKMQLHVDEICRNFSFQHIEKFFELIPENDTLDDKQIIQMQEYFISKLFECLNDLPMPILIHNKEFLIMFANKAYLGITGKTCEGLLGQYYGNVFPEHCDESHICVCKLGGYATHHGIKYKLYSFPMEGKEGCYQLSLHFFEDIQKISALIETVRALSLALEQRDPYTAGHQKRVALLAKAIAKELGLSDNQILSVELGALIHDIGKIHIPLSILSKTSVLDEEEHEIVKTHVLVGYQIVKDIHFPWPIRDILMQHHERLNGSGYPKGLAGDKICMEAQIVGVADMVENMKNFEQSSIATIVDELSSMKGNLFDAKIIDACITLIKDKNFTFEGA